jgi:hypothetical protein
MCLLAFGASIAVVNGSAVTHKQRSFAELNRSHLTQFVVEGWVIQSQSPTRIVHAGRGISRTLFGIDQTLLPPAPREKVEESPRAIEKKVQAESLKQLPEVSRDVRPLCGTAEKKRETRCVRPPLVTRQRRKFRELDDLEMPTIAFALKNGPPKPLGLPDRTVDQRVPKDEKKALGSQSNQLQETPPAQSLLN